MIRLKLEAKVETKVFEIVSHCHIAIRSKHVNDHDGDCGNNKRNDTPRTHDKKTLDKNI